MLREAISGKLKDAMRSKDTLKTATLRLIIAAIQDRDIAVRTDGNPDGISDDEVMKVLQTMVKQRQESIKMYEKGNRPELAAQEAKEISIIRAFMPEQMSNTEIELAVSQLLVETGASSLKDMGSSMAALRKLYAGRMDFGKASEILKAALTG